MDGGNTPRSKVVRLLRLSRAFGKWSSIKSSHTRQTNFRSWRHNYGMSVRTTIEISADLHAALRRRAVAEGTSIRSLITNAIESEFLKQPSRRVTGPLVGKKTKPAVGSPDGENPYDVLFA